MKHEDLDKWAVPHDQLPRRLFFVRHEYSQCGSEDEWNSDMEGDGPASELGMMGGLTAACPKAIICCLHEITNIVDLYRKMKRHLKWTSSRPSCFVSTFGNFHDAVLWGGQLPGIVRIYSIDTTKLPPIAFVHVFRPSDFNMFWRKDEYLFLHQIPERGIECFVVLPDYLKTTREY
ncbi:hypothetical protein NEUTE1DRAFT_50025 [Neurospora tetrasperma FGSC 2508]|uniref:DUF7587 domain-containing protein n=1 Tax=Neurospora tetrasperma (strain FGSC 2508 / ATCC MYA-4615 / P0657) TaxID=510951 RepID=F8MVZ8_NEUT8|nr:uncharacterized protein NEUTE1DRAFT_50025 [Neurospora tetrasperma FGSC 2508]EGO54846.1 hypothetical protein NEUTE1DRAFT_50025 [Neurospora tetrasperma FGSC 2508]EGZ67665.1 hypothetical protein NEUTE2DRAFT_132346 [Neurospora tetrasperma FGSC 2509]